MACDVMTVRLHLPQIRVLEVVEDTPGALVVSVESTFRRLRCAQCGFKCRRVHDRRAKKIRDLEVSGRRTVLVWSRRRMVCDNCDSRFLEDHPAGWQALQELHGLYLADDYDGALKALGRFCDLYQTGELPQYHDTHTGGALSVGLGLTLSTTGPSGAFTMICRPGPAGGARTDRSGGRDLIGALS